MGRQSVTGHVHTPSVANPPACMFVDSKREAENPEEPHDRMLNLVSFYD